jgi:hypothetical protein
VVASIHIALMLIFELLSNSMHLNLELERLDDQDVLRVSHICGGH